VTTDNILVEMAFKCDRCKYQTDRAHDFKKHLQKKKPCPLKNSDISMKDMFNKYFPEEDRSDFDFCCEKCDKRFRTAQGKCNHKKICKGRIRIKIPNINEEVKHVDEKPDMLNKFFHEKDRSDFAFCCEKCNKRFRTAQGKCNHKKICKVHINVPSSKINNDTRLEKHYQIIVEKITSGSHKRLACGVTDITTDVFHAEIKRWICWKEALGQLLAYNHFDKKLELRVYLFGEYSQKYKNIAIEAFKNYNIRCFQFLDEYTCEMIPD
jgi:hypothetical protein